MFSSSFSTPQPSVPALSKARPSHSPTSPSVQASSLCNSISERIRSTWILLGDPTMRRGEQPDVSLGLTECALIQRQQLAPRALRVWLVVEGLAVGLHR